MRLQTSEKPFSKDQTMSRWADGLLSAWMLFVAAVYFGGYFAPVIGQYTAQSSAVYALMLLVSVAAFFSGRSRASVKPVSGDAESARAGGAERR